MKKYFVLSLLLGFSFGAVAQHHLAHKGPAAKNYKTSTSKVEKNTKVLVYANPEDKYETGANAKNRMITTEAEKVEVKSQERKRIFGPAFKNRKMKKEKGTPVQESQNPVRETEKVKDVILK